MTDAKGLCNVFEDAKFKDSRLFLFELDGHMSEISQDIETLLQIYIKNKMDVLMHRTKKGFHFLTPTMIGIAQWKNFMKEVKYLNPKCPMTTLRITPNKYPDEKEIWYIAKAHYAAGRGKINSLEVANLLNRWFNTEFIGDEKAPPKIVTYELPKVEAV